MTLEIPPKARHPSFEEKWNFRMGCAENARQSFEAEISHEDAWALYCSFCGIDMAAFSDSEILINAQGEYGSFYYYLRIAAHAAFKTLEIAVNRKYEAAMKIHRGITSGASYRDGSYRLTIAV